MTYVTRSATHSILQNTLQIGNIALIRCLCHFFRRLCIPGELEITTKRPVEAMSNSCPKWGLCICISSYFIILRFPNSMLPGIWGCGQPGSTWKSHRRKAPRRARSGAKNRAACEAFFPESHRFWRGCREQTLVEVKPKDNRQFWRAPSQADTSPYTELKITLSSTARHDSNFELFRPV